MSIIEDGTGKGLKAGVDKNNRILVNSVTQTVEHFANSTMGKSWNVLIQQTPTAANDCFFYFKNTGTLSIIFERAGIFTASSETLELFLRDSGTPAGGTPLFATNLNTVSNNIPSATILGGNDITGITKVDLSERVFVVGGETYRSFKLDQNIILSPGGVASIYAVTGGIQVNITLSFYETSI